ncbi:dienelactone hydrolase family protein [Tessaracoccus antarcticus]|uniref:Dienelactone hydrolase family protein n=1 Tax=Tessaracoccus antarcticus TaxID=2479848 RepID=A0A3M0GGF2_9ACTN|nr:dienelactone hydrolase family protein [Tessaracoccus antarcticus]RMB60219.1 dienelactone hydrolase family protein [Tessaracoccus antarcticus]
MSETVLIPTDGGAMPAHLWLPASGTGPGVALMQEIFGISGYIERRARHLADLGYVVLAPEIYWRLGPGATAPIEGPDALQEGVARSGAVDWDAAVADGAATVQSLRDREDVTGGVGLVGFCFGGGLAFAVAAALETQDPAQPVDALVSYYGSALPGLVEHHRVGAPSLHHFGLADDFIPVETVRRIEATLTLQPETAIMTYAGANHAFDNGDMPWFHAQASELAWSRTAHFLADRLQKSTGASS